MRYKVFGQHTGLRISEIVLGTGMFGTASGYGAEPDAARDMLKGFVEAGGNFIDTADAYQLGQAEQLVGELLKTHRDDFVIASKFRRGANREASLTGIGNSRKAMVQAVEASLRRLGTDRIDIYMAHVDDGITPVEEIMRGLDELVRAGKVLYAGLANF